eukprot:1178372-Prorocentrum_minimum.AAC.1
MVENGTCRASISFEQSVDIRGARQGGNAIWIRYKHLNAQVTEDVRPEFNDMRTNGELPSGQKRELVERAVTVCFYKKLKHDERSLEELEEQVPATWTCAFLEYCDGTMSLWGAGGSRISGDRDFSKGLLSGYDTVGKSSATKVEDGATKYRLSIVFYRSSKDNR